MAEHRARLLAGTASGGGDELGALLTAARAGLFLASVDDGDPELCLTAEAVSDRLALRGTQPPSQDVAAMRELVVSLPAYR